MNGRLKTIKEDEDVAKGPNFLFVFFSVASRRSPGPPQAEFSRPISILPPNGPRRLNLVVCRHRTGGYS